MAKDNTYIFESEKIIKAMISLAVPSILISVVDLIYNAINAYFVGQLNNTAMIASMSLAGSIDMLIESVGACVGIGGASYLGRQLGAKNEKGIYETVRTSITLCLVLTILHVAFGLLVLKPYINWQTTDPEVIKYAYTYGIIQIFMMAFLVIRTTCVHLLRSSGDYKFPTVIITISVVANAILDPFLMFDWGLGLSIYGAGIATAIVRFVTCMIFIGRLCSRKIQIYWKPFDFNIDRQISWEILRVGIPCYVRNALPSIANLVYTKQVFKFGTDFVAGCSVGRRASHFMNYFIQGMANGYLPFASYNYGAKNYKRLWKAITWNLTVLTAYSLGVGALMLLFARPYVGLFTTSELAVEYGVQYAKAYTTALPVYAAYYIFTVSLQAAGKGKESMWLSISRQGLIYIPVILLMPKFFKEVGIYYSQPLADWLTVITAIILSWPLLKEIRYGMIAQEKEKTA